MTANARDREDGHRSTAAARPSTVLWAARLCLLHALGQGLAAMVRLTVYVLSGDPHIADRFPHDARWFVPLTLVLGSSFAIAGKGFDRRPLAAWFVALGAHVVLVCIGVLGDPTLVNVNNLLGVGGLALLLSPATTAWIGRQRRPEIVTADDQ